MIYLPQSTLLSFATDLFKPSFMTSVFPIHDMSHNEL